VTLRLPHPLVLLLGAVAVAAALSWVVPAGQYDRRDDPATGRRIAVAGTFHRVEAAPVSPFQALVAVPRGFVEGADVVAVVLFVGGAWVVVDRLGTLSRAVALVAWRFRRRGLWAIPLVSLLFASLGGLENMQEEIIPLVPVMLVLGRGLGVDAVTVVAMSAGAAAVGSAFSPVNPFQAGLALKLAQLPLLSGAAVRATSLVLAFGLWVGWTMGYASRRRSPAIDEATPPVPLSPRDTLILAVVLLPMAAYVYGALRLDWGFNELSGAFFAGGLAAGLIGGLGVGGTITTLLEGMQSILPSVMIIGVARSISLVLADGRIVDSILHALVEPLAHVPGALSGLLMIPFSSLIHIPVPSVSGQAVLTMPLLVPMADVLGLSRQIPVLAYQTGAGMMEILTPTNGAMMAVLLAANVPYGQWMRFALVGWLLTTAVGVAAIAAVVWLGAA
jgi:uncharacterized ion transporter superfamily protein YfcC